MSGVWVFGYGSLVNLDTHPFRPSHPVRLKGWQRTWRHWINTPERQVVSLTVAPHEGAEMDGLLIWVETAQQSALDARERGYERIILPKDTFPDAPDGEVLLYQSLTDQAGSATHPILQSYLDCVLKGFEVMGGPNAVSQFIAETGGWSTPIYKDRADPIYPRAIDLTEPEAARYDAALAASGAIWLDQTQSAP